MGHSEKKKICSCEWLLPQNRISPNKEMVYLKVPEKQKFYKPKANTYQQKSMRQKKKKRINSLNMWFLEKNLKIVAEEIAHQSKCLPVKHEDPGSIPSTTFAQGSNQKSEP